MNKPHTLLPSHVATSLKEMIKNVQVTGDSIDDDDLDEAVGLDFVIKHWPPSSLFEGC
jgi:hypothetical protein